MMYTYVGSMRHARWEASEMLQCSCALGSAGERMYEAANGRHHAVAIPNGPVQTIRARFRCVLAAVKRHSF